MAGCGLDGSRLNSVLACSVEESTGATFLVEAGMLLLTPVGRVRTNVTGYSLKVE